MSESYDIEPISIKDYDINDLYPTSHSNFSLVEGDWLRDTFMARFCQLNGKKRVVPGDPNPSSSKKSGKKAPSQSKSSISQTEELQNIIFECWLRRFPFRDPDYRGNEYPKELVKRLRLSPEDYEKTPKRLYDWLQRRKPDDAKKSASAGRFKPNATPKATYPSDHYAPRKADLLEESKTLQLILDLSQDMYCSLETEEVQEFRDNITVHIDNVMRAINRIANIEMLSLGVWLQGDTAYSFQVATSRTKLFASLQETNILREQFLTYALNMVGPHLDIPDEEPAAVVYGNPDRDYEPVFPLSNFAPPRLAYNLDLYFNAMWRWAGGQGDVPYDRLEADTVDGVYALVDKARLPPGITVFRSPFDLAMGDLSTWAKHVRLRWPEDNAFQFLQPRPGQYDVSLRTRAQEHAYINYPAESLLYYDYLHKWRVGCRADELPGAVSGQHYVSIPPSVLKKIDDSLNTSDRVLREILAFLPIHDSYFPVHCELSLLEKAREHVPFMVEDLPGPFDDLCNFVLQNGLDLPPEFWVKTRRQAQWRIGNMIKFVSTNNWTHKQSNTLLGGPNGYKWPALFLLIVGSNCSRFNGVAILVQDGVQEKLKLPESWMNTFHHAADQFLKALQKSAAVLSDTVEERTLTSEDEPNGPAWLQSSDGRIEPPETAAVYGVPRLLDEWTIQDIQPVPLHHQAHRSLRSIGKRQAEPGTSPPQKRGRKSVKSGPSGRRKRESEESPEAEESEFESEDDEFVEGESDDSAGGSTANET